MLTPIERLAKYNLTKADALRILKAKTSYDFANLSDLDAYLSSAEDEDEREELIDELAIPLHDHVSTLDAVKARVAELYAAGNNRGAYVFVDRIATDWLESLELSHR